MLHCLHSKRCEKPQALRLLAVARSSLEQNLSGFSIALLHRIHDARPGIGRNRDAVDEHEDRFGEVQVEQRLGSGEFDNLSILVEPVETAFSQLEQALFE